MHLKHLGHPIANDALYLQKTVLRRSTEATTADQAAARVKGGSSADNCCCTDTSPLPTGSDEENALLNSEECAGGSKHMSSEPFTRLKAESVEAGASTDQSGRVDCEKRQQCRAGQILRSRDGRGSPDGKLCSAEDFTVDPMCTNCPNWEPAG